MPPGRRARLRILPAVDVEAAQLFFSFLALAAIAGAAVVLIARLSGQRAGIIGEIVRLADDAGLWIAAAIATTSMTGSLYFSEVANYVPCQLCWFQRIAMYPLAVILVIAAIRRDRSVRWYVAPVAAVGAAIAGYHYLIEWRPSLEGGACGVGPSCADIWFRELGFVTLAFMALCGFLSILVFVLPTPRSHTEALS